MAERIRESQQGQYLKVQNKIIAKIQQNYLHEPVLIHIIHVFSSEEQYEWSWKQNCIYFNIVEVWMHKIV